MKLGYSAATAGLYDLDEVFRFAHDLGLNFVELNFDTFDFMPGAQVPGRVLELKRATGIDVSLHLPFVDLNIASLMPTLRRASVMQTLRGLEYALNIGAVAAVLHTGHVFLYQPVPREHALDALHESLKAFEVSPVPLALENLAVFEDGLIRGPEMLRAITARFGFGNCLDFGHAHIEASRPWREGTGEDLISHYIETLDPAILHLHLCNNDGQADLHTATGEGSIRFRDYVDYLSNFEGTMCLEVAGGKPAVERSVAHIRSLAGVAA